MPITARYRIEPHSGRTWYAKMQPRSYEGISQPSVDPSASEDAVQVQQVLEASRRRDLALTGSRTVLPSLEPYSLGSTSYSLHGRETSRTTQHTCGSTSMPCTSRDRDRNHICPGSRSLAEGHAAISCQQPAPAMKGMCTATAAAKLPRSRGKHLSLRHMHNDACI